MASPPDFIPYNPDEHQYRLAVMVGKRRLFVPLRAQLGDLESRTLGHAPSDIAFAALEQSHGADGARWLRPLLKKNPQWATATCSGIAGPLSLAEVLIVGMPGCVGEKDAIRVLRHWPAETWKNGLTLALHHGRMELAEWLWQHGARWEQPPTIHDLSATLLSPNLTPEGFLRPNKPKKPGSTGAQDNFEVTPERALALAPDLFQDETAGPLNPHKVFLLILNQWWTRMRDAGLDLTGQSTFVLTNDGDENTRRESAMGVLPLAALTYPALLRKGWLGDSEDRCQWWRMWLEPSLDAGVDWAGPVVGWKYQEPDPSLAELIRTHIPRELITWLDEERDRRLAEQLNRSITLAPQRSSSRL